jgi:hypothetical protein
LASVGLGGCVTSKGWMELHNPSSSKLSVKMFSINNCTAKVGRSSTSDNADTTNDDIQDLGEFKLALRTLRTAASFVQPWNHNFLAIEGFMMQSQYCQADLASLEKRAVLLTQFVDYCIGRMRTAGETKNPSSTPGNSRIHGQPFSVPVPRLR